MRARYVPNGGWCAVDRGRDPGHPGLGDRPRRRAQQPHRRRAEPRPTPPPPTPPPRSTAANDGERPGRRALAGDTIADLEALLAALGGVDAGDIIDNRLLALAALQTGWNADPTFQLWTSGLPEKWTATGLSGNGGPFAGFYGGGLALDIGAGAIAVTLTASSARGRADAGRRPRGRRGWCSTRSSPSPPATPTRSACAPSGWRTARGTWTAGDMLGADRAGRHASPSSASARGPASCRASRCWCSARPGSAPVPTACASSWQKVSAVTTAVDCDVHLLGLRAGLGGGDRRRPGGGRRSRRRSRRSRPTITGVADALAAYQVGRQRRDRRASPRNLARQLPDHGLRSPRRSRPRTTTLERLDRRGLDQPRDQLLHQGRRSTAASPPRSAASSTTLGGQIDDAARGDQRRGRLPGGRRRRARRPGRARSRRAATRARRLERQLRHRRLRRLERRRGPRRVHRRRQGRHRLGAAELPDALHAEDRAPTPRPRRIGNERFEAKEGDIVLGLVRSTPRRHHPRRHAALPRALARRRRRADRRARPDRGRSPTTGTAWAGFSAPSIGPAPAGTAYVRVELSRARRRLRRRLRDRHRRPQGRHRGAGAASPTVEAVAASACGAIASLTTSINASFGSQSAFVSADLGGGRPRRRARRDLGVPAEGRRRGRHRRGGRLHRRPTARRSRPSRSTTTTSTSTAGSAPATW